MRLKTCGSGREKETMQRDLREAEILRNGKREMVLKAANLKRSTREQLWIQPSSCLFSDRNRHGVSVIRRIRERPLPLPSVRNLISAKWYFRGRGTHDFETRQHCLSVPGLSWRRSTMWSSISGGRWGFDIVVWVKPLFGAPLPQSTAHMSVIPNARLNVTMNALGDYVPSVHPRYRPSPRSQLTGGRNESGLPTPRTGSVKSGA